MNWTFTECQVGSPKEGILGYVKVNLGVIQAWLTVKKGKHGSWATIPSITRNDGASFEEVYTLADSSENKRLCLEAKKYFDNYQPGQVKVSDSDDDLPF